MVKNDYDDDEYKQEYKPEPNSEPGGDENTGGGALEPEAYRKLFVGGLSISTTDEGLRQFYSQFGDLVDCVVMRDGATKKSRGFGFVSFSRQSEVDHAMSSRPHVIDGRTVDPKRAVPREQSIKAETNISTKRLFVNNIHEEHSEDGLAQYFSSYGSVEKAEIIVDKATGKPRGFAFVTFDDYDSVDKCVLQKSHMIAGYRCDVKKALSKDEMVKAAQMDRERMERGSRSRGTDRSGPWSGGRGGYGGHGYGGGHGGWAGPAAGGWGAPQAPGGWGGAPSGGYGGGYGAGYGGAGGGWEAPAQAGSGGWGAGGSGGWSAGPSSGGGGYGGGAPASGYGGGAAGGYGGGAPAAGGYGSGAASGYGGAAPSGGSGQWGGAPSGGASTNATGAGQWSRAY